jgi:transposase
MERRKFTREFKLQAVKLIKERGLSYVQATSDLGVQHSVPRNWVHAFGIALLFPAYVWLSGRFFSG